MRILPWKGVHGITYLLVAWPTFKKWVIRKSFMVHQPEWIFGAENMKKCDRWIRAQKIVCPELHPGQALITFFRISEIRKRELASRLNRKLYCFYHCTGYRTNLLFLIDPMLPEPLKGIWSGWWGRLHLLPKHKNCRAIPIECVNFRFCFQIYEFLAIWLPGSLVQYEKLKFVEPLSTALLIHTIWYSLLSGVTKSYQEL